MAREFLYDLFCTKCDQKTFDQLNRLTRTNTIMRWWRLEDLLRGCCARVRFKKSFHTELLIHSLAHSLSQLPCCLRSLQWFPLFCFGENQIKREHVIGWYFFCRKIIKKIFKNLIWKLARTQRDFTKSLFYFSWPTHNSITWCDRHCCYNETVFSLRRERRSAFDEATARTQWRDFYRDRAVRSSLLYICMCVFVLLHRFLSIFILVDDDAHTHLRLNRVLCLLCLHKYARWRARID